ncbi:type IV pilus biogenesis/stability protein PilW [Acidovorax sp. NCPPB 3576]|uniref:type IV pilus biogenesis/stability protein PilW n=1 Tax=Acidovorax sp. NCPPB 3576 TaxID=2940488 RepID=UPI003FA49FD9
MTRSVAVFERHARLAMALCFATIGVAGLGGCAATGGMNATSASAEYVTPSEETETRRRARLRLELAANYLEMGQTTVALDEVRQSLATDPSYGDAYNLRGLIYLRLGDLPLAEDSFRRALGFHPSEPNLLHNYGWLLCQQQKYAESQQYFERALASRTYNARSKTLMAQGLCQERAGQIAEAEQTLLKAYELDAGNPVVGYNLSSLMFRRGEVKRAQFYIRRLNNGEFANAESLWLGIKIERAQSDSVAMRQLAEQLRKRFPDSKELMAYDRGAFNE